MRIRYGAKHTSFLLKAFQKINEFTKVVSLIKNSVKRKGLRYDFSDHMRNRTRGKGKLSYGLLRL